MKVLGSWPKPLNSQHCLTYVMAWLNLCYFLFCVSVKPWGCSTMHFQMLLQSTGNSCFADMKYGLLTKPEVKMTGYWPSPFFVCLWTKMESRSINSQEKEEGQYPAILTKKSWLIKELVFGFRGNFSDGTRWVVLRGQNTCSSILPAVANCSSGFNLYHLSCLQS